MSKVKVGVFLARMQPLHNAHIFLVEKACKENDKVIVILGSANKKDMIRNPFSIELRESMLKRAIHDSLGVEYANKIEVYELPDWSQEADYNSQKEWGSYLYYNIVSRANCKTFNIYFSDEPSIMLNWFTDEIKERIEFKFSQRENIFDGLSATKIREAFTSGDISYIESVCPQCICEEYKNLKAIWDSVLNDPQADFSMV